jgi:hypothetical protein
MAKKKQGGKKPMQKTATNPRVARMGQPLNTHLSDSIANWLASYVEATRPRPTKRAVVEDALENYFRQKGFPHPDEAP